MAKEGLAYCLRRRTFGFKPPAPNATDKEIWKDFYTFCVKGLLDANNEHMEAPDNTGPMTGTLNWLAALGKFKAHFYVAFKPALMFFVSLADESDPWSDLPGFMACYIEKGDLTLKLGKTGELVSKGEYILEPREDLDDALADMEHMIRKVSPEKRPRFIAALRGDKGTNLNKVIDRLDATEGLGLRNLFDERLAALEMQNAFNERITDLEIQQAAQSDTKKKKKK